MNATKKEFKNVDEYIKNYPEDIQRILEKIRESIKEVIPNSEELISYDMPTFKVGGKYVLGYAAWKKHIGIYPAPIGDEEIAKYTTAKGTIQLPLHEPISYELVKKIALLRLKQL